jgi:hypothetical protein
MTRVRQCSNAELIAEMRDAGQQPQGAFDRDMLVTAVVSYRLYTSSLNTPEKQDAARPVR